MGLLDRLGDRLGEFMDEVLLPDTARRALDLAQAQLAHGDPTACLRTCDDVDRARPGLGRTLLLRGLALEALGDDARAAAELQRLVHARDHISARIALGRIAARVGDLRAARQQYEAALDLRPDDAERLEILLWLAAIQEQAGSRASAAAALRHAVRLAPDDPAIRVRLARALRDDDDLDGAIDALRPLMQRDPPPLDAALELAEACLDRALPEDLDEAVRVWERILARSDDNPDALEGLGRAHLLRGHPADALPLLHRALQTATASRRAPLHQTIGVCHLRVGDLANARDALHRAIDLRPDDPDLLALGASIALRADELPLADTWSERALAAAPDDRGVRALRARVLLRHDRIDDARRLLASLRTSDRDVAVLHALAELSLRTGDPIEGIAMLREVRVLDPDRPDVADALQNAIRALAPRLPAVRDDRITESGALGLLVDALAPAIAAFPLLLVDMPALHALRQQLDMPLSIAVLGEFNAGKSTTLNALFGEEMLATGVLPTTSHINVIRWGPRPIARVDLADGGRRELSWKDAARIVRDDPEQLRGIEILHPHPDLHVVHFWDTPGFNADHEDHEARATVALRTADAILWILDAGQALTASENDRIAAIGDADQRLIVVLNKIDRLADDPDALDEVLAHVRRHLDGRCRAILPVAARDALRAHAARDDDALARSGIPALRDLVDQHFVARIDALKALEGRRELARLLRTTLDRATAWIRALDGHRAEAQRLRATIDARTDTLPRETARQFHRRADDALLRLRLRLADETIELATPGEGLFASARLAPEDRSALLARVPGRVRDALRTALADLDLALRAVDAEVVEAIEALAAAIGPPESRTILRRLEGWLTETRAMRQLLDERLVAAWARIVASRVAERGDALLLAVAAEPGRTEAERETAMRRLVPILDDNARVTAELAVAEYLQTAVRLFDRVERDADILALDLEHRIIRPFEEVLLELAPHEEPEAHAPSVAP